MGFSLSTLILGILGFLSITTFILITEYEKHVRNYWQGDTKAEKILLLNRIQIFCWLLVVFFCGTAFVSGMKDIAKENEVIESEKKEKTAIKIDGEIIKVNKKTNDTREVTIQTFDGENIVITKFIVYEEDEFIGKAGEHFSGKISSKNIISSEIVKTEIKTE